ncbi:MAG TPA: MarR family transcriptional regulator [Candidatus Limnocylindrales bacterium]|nr:MarR family transcriptional regulator [Candidatus Limnocylindrales bacterium]
MPKRAEPSLLPAVERIVVASVAATARALVEVAPQLTFLQWRLLVLVDTPDGVSVGALGASIGSKIAAMSRLVGRLRNRGLVRTQRSPDDARIVLVRLTDAGRDLRTRVVTRRRAELAAAIDAAALPTDAADVATTLASLLEGLG